MELSDTPVSQRTHISFFGCTNAGKSSIVNALTNQNVSLVSEIKGTTTDPVKKTMELLPIGPVVIIDTAGIDDKSELGELRIEKTNQILSKTDIAILVIDALKGLNDFDSDLINRFKEKNIPYILVYNKSDLLIEKNELKENEIYTSVVNNENITKLKEKIGSLAKNTEKTKYIIADKLEKNDIVVLVIPIDEAAPKGRLILPQQLIIRELLDFNITVVCSQDTSLKETLESLSKKPKLVITDSQAFKKVSQIVPNDIYLTSFSILFAKYKGELDELIKGKNAISRLKDNDYILISEGCTHHRQCNDIGSVKIPKMLMNYTNKTFNFEFSSGYDFATDLSKYSLIIHCGGCMLNEKEMKHRISVAKEKNIPIINYGVLIAYLTGILDRSLEFLL